MAKKQVATLTVEERLQQALVPESEHPYKLPDNWCWTIVNSVADLYRGVSYKKHEAHFAKLDNDCLIMRGGNIQEGVINVCDDNVYVDKSIVSDRQLVKKNDIVIVSSTGSLKVIGRAGVSKENYTDVAFGAFLTLVRPKAEYVGEFVAYFFQTEEYRNRIRVLASGVNINNIRNEYIYETPIPLPPLAEQQRIVKRIEGLFAKLDEAKEKTQAALDSFETRKAAMLHKAFTGELTAKWRRKNGVSMDSWEWKYFNDIADIKSNLVDPAKYMDFPHIAPDNIEKKTGVLLNYNTIYEDKVISGKHHFYPNQILYSKIRPYLSKVVIVDFEGLCSADMYPIEAKENRRYLWYFMLSEDFLEQASSAGSRSVLPKINQKELSQLRVSICSLKEQTEIVRILDSFFAKEQRAKGLCAVLENINLIKKSILARAFRGELGTNDPNDESAVELLKILDSKDIYEALVAKPQKLDNLIELEKMNLKKTILEVLNDGEVLTPEQLKLKTGLNIDDFYSELKILVDERKVRDRRENGESFLEVNNES